MRDALTFNETRMIFCALACNLLLINAIISRDLNIFYLETT
jgi:hypothetical protein